MSKAIANAVTMKNQPNVSPMNEARHVNHDGKIDTWDLMDEQGRLIKRAHDANGDGRVDQHWTFDPTRPGCATIVAEVDGRVTPGSAIDVCKQLSNGGR